MDRARGDRMRNSIRLASLVTLSLAACGDDGGARPDGGASTTIGVTISSAQPVTVTAASRLSVSLYGHDAFLADASATLILHQVEAVTALPFTFDLVLPADPHLLIDQGHG